MSNDGNKLLVHDAWRLFFLCSANSVAYTRSPRFAWWNSRCKTCYFLLGNATNITSKHIRFLQMFITIINPHDRLTPATDKYIDATVYRSPYFIRFVQRWRLMYWREWKFYITVLLLYLQVVISLMRLLSRCCIPTLFLDITRLSLWRMIENTN